MNNSIKQTYLKSLGWLGLSKFITQITTWSATIIIARLLTPADYGLVGMAGLISGFIMLIGDFGLGTSIIQKKKVSHSELSSLFVFFIIIGFIISLIIFFTAPIGGYFFKENEVTSLIKLSSITFFFNSIGQVPRSLLQKRMNFKKYGIAQSLSSILSSIIVLILAYNKFGAYSLMYGTIANSFLLSTFSFYYSNFIPNLYLISLENVKYHLNFGMKLTLQTYFWYYYSNVDYLIAGKLLGKTAYGTYSLAFQLVSIPIEKIASIINPISLPALSSIENTTDKINFFFLKVKYMAFIIFPIFVGFFWCADDMIFLLLGKKWIESILIFKILSIVCILRCLSILNSSLLNSIRRADVGLKNMIISSIIATITFLLFVKMGPKGLAYAWLVFYPPIFIYFIYNTSKAVGFKLQDYIKNIEQPFINTIFMSIIIFIATLLLQNYKHILIGYNFRLLKGITIIFTGIISYSLFAFIFDKKTCTNLLHVIKEKT